MKRLPKASGKALFEVSGPVLVLSTRMACTSEQAEGRSFLFPRQAALFDSIQRVLAGCGGSARRGGVALESLESGD